MLGGDRLRGRYGTAVAIALLGLGPNVVLSTAFGPLEELIGRDLHATPTGLQLAEGMGNAGYAVGAVLAAQLAQRIGQRRLFLGYQVAFVVGSVLAAAAPGLAPFFAGRAVQGVAAGAMLISSLPPLVTRFGVRRLTLTVVIVDIGLFGLSTVGPIVGSLAAAAGSWRWLLAAAAALGVLGWLVAAVGYERIDPLDPELPVDRLALALVVVATGATFYATSVLAGAAPGSPQVAIPFVAGILAVVVLLLAEARKERPLMPVGSLATQLPVTGTLAAMVGGAVFVGVLQLVLVYLADVAGKGPTSVAALLWPVPAGLLVAAVLFGLLFPTRYVPVLVDAGLLALVAGSALLLGLDRGHPDPWVLGAGALLGFGAGATVSPGLFLTGLGLPSVRLGRAFALVQLLRSMATYAVAPVVLYVAQTSSGLVGGVRAGLVAMVVLAAAGLGAAVAIPALSGARLRAPDLDSWLEGGQALPSPITGTHLRRGPRDEAAEPFVPQRLRRRRR